MTPVSLKCTQCGLLAIGEVHHVYQSSDYIELTVICKCCHHTSTLRFPLAKPDEKSTPISF